MVMMSPGIASSGENPVNSIGSEYVSSVLLVYVTLSATTDTRPTSGPSTGMMTRISEILPSEMTSMSWIGSTPGITTSLTFWRLLPKILRAPPLATGLGAKAENLTCVSLNCSVES